MVKATTTIKHRLLDGTEIYINTNHHRTQIQTQQCRQIHSRWHGCLLSVARSLFSSQIRKKTQWYEEIQQLALEKRTENVSIQNKINTQRARAHGVHWRKRVAHVTHSVLLNFPTTRNNAFQLTTEWQLKH